MRISKNYFYIAAIVIVVIIAGVFSYNYYLKLKEPIAAVFNAIPTDVVAFAEFNNIYDLWNNKMKSNKIWANLQKLQLFDKTQQDINFINTIINLNEDIKDIIIKQKAVVSVNLKADGSTGFIYLCNVPLAFDADNINDMLKDSGIKNITKSEEENTTIYMASTTSTTYYYTIKNCIFIGSVSKELVIKSIKQLKSGTPLSKDKNFVNISSTAGKKVDANIYLNFKYLSEYFHKISNENSLINYNFISELAYWTEIDLIVKENQLLLNGFSSSVGNFLDIFSEEPTEESKIANVLPEKTIMFSNFQFSNYATYFNRYRNFLKSRNKHLKSDNEINKENLMVKFNLKDNFIEWMGNSYTIAVLKSENLSSENVFVICKTSDSHKADSCLKEIAKASQTNFSKETANRIQINNLLKTFLGDICPSMDECWYESFNEYIIFGNSKNSVLNYKESLYNNEILANNKEYSDYSSGISNQSNIWTYFNLDLAADFFKYTLKQHFTTNFDKNYSVLKNFHKASFQWSFTDNRFYTTLNLGFNIADSIITKKEETTKMISSGKELQLENMLIGQPYLLQNTSDNDKNILVFDASNNLYNIDKEFNIRWKYKIDKKPISDIYEIDYYKNRKIQYLFNTENYIYLIDAKGNNVENYPIKLTKKATSSLSLIDYENNRNYRLLIPNTDRNIAYYDIKGKIIADFKSPVMNDNIESPPQHIVHGGKDYLIISDKSGKFLILDRKGKERIKLKTAFLKNTFSNFYSDGKYLITTDQANDVRFISLNGETVVKSFDKVNGNAHFYYEDFNNDGVKDFIFINLNELLVFKKSGKLIFNYKFSTNVFNKLYFFENTGRGKLIVALGMNKQLYVFDKKGLLDESITFKGECFPIISVLNDQKQLNLITAYGNKLLKYTFQ